MEGRFLFLGTGSSTGVPIIGCDCDVCRSSSLFNKRHRSSGLVTIGDKKLLIDVGPDFRTQALNYGIKEIDALLLTHTHFDHIAGIDDLRVFYFRRKEPLECLLSEETLASLKDRYHYLFLPIGEVPTTSAQLSFKMIEEDYGEVDFLDMKIGYISYFQGNMKVTGFRFGDFAYVSDIREFTDEVFVILRGVKKLVVSAPVKKPSALHFSLDEGIEFARRVGAEKTWFTHLSHQIDYDNIELPDGIRLAHDGLEIDFTIS